MAEFTGNTVPLGEAGTGAAFILPQSQAIQQGMDFIDKQQKDKADAQVLAQKQAQQLAASWQKNRLNIKAGTLWQPEINAKANEVIQTGLKLRKSGLDPSQYYNDPAKQALVDDYNAKKQNVESMAETRDKFAEQAKGVDTEIDKSIPGELDPDSINNYHQFFNTPLSSIMANGHMMPNIRKAYDLQKDIDALPTSPIETTSLPDKNGIIQSLTLPDHDAHLRTAENFVNNSPKVQALISKKTGIPFNAIGNETNPAVIKKQLDDHYRSLPNIPSLAAQGVNTFGGLAGGNTNTQGVPDAGQSDQKYDQLITSQANQLANAAKVKNELINGTASQLDDKIHKQHNLKFSDAYNEAQDRREKMGWERQRFDAWAKDQQNESGTFQLGNQGTYVPVAKTWVNPDGKTNPAGKAIPAGVEPEKGASLYGVNLPAVETIVKPSMVTNTTTGRTIKNTNPINVKVSQIQMVPVFKDLGDNNDLNGSEVSARQLKDMIGGNSKNYSLSNLTFMPFAYGIKTDKAADGVHTVQTPVKFSYDALKGSNVKKINTSTFDKATQDLQQLQANPKFQGLTPEQKMDFLSKRYNLNLD